MESIRNSLMTCIVHVDEFVLGGREKDKVGGSYNAKKRKTITAVE